MGSPDSCDPARRESTGATMVDRSVYEPREKTERTVRNRLGAGRWNDAHAAGRKTSIDSLMKEIDSTLEQAKLL
jgi:hypothetical protein